MTVTEQPSTAAKAPRDFTYIVPRGRRISEYEAVTCYAQPDPDGFDKQGWYLRTPEGRTAWMRESTRLVHPHWFDFRDPANQWQRTYVRMQAEQERAIERTTADALASGSIAKIDVHWLKDLVGGHYRTWAFFEYGLFRAFAAAQREALSDTLGNALCFEGVDRIRHAQAIVIFLLEFEESLEGFVDDGAKQRWLEDPAYQPARSVCEHLMLETSDWAELAVATNLVVDPILSEVAVSRLVGRFGPFHGDMLTPFLVSTTERDRRRNQAWTEELVKMVTGASGPDGVKSCTTPDGAPAVEHNRAVIQEWLEHWTPLAIAAAEALAPVYELPPLQIARLEDVIAEACSAQAQLVESLGFSAVRS